MNYRTHGIRFLLATLELELIRFKGNKQAYQDCLQHVQLRFLFSKEAEFHEMQVPFHRTIPCPWYRSRTALGEQLKGTVDLLHPCHLNATMKFVMMSSDCMRPIIVNAVDETTPSRKTLL